MYLRCTLARIAGLLVCAGLLLASARTAAGQQMLTVSLAGNGSGSVTSTPAGINCPSTCSASFGTGSMVTLAASAATGSTFAGWSGGGCTGTGGCIVTMSNAINVTATFTLNSYTLTVNRAGNGSGTVTSTPAGINCGGTCSSLYNYGTLVSLTASASVGSTFAGWSGGGCTGTGGCNVTMASAATVTATFTLSTYTLTANSAGTGSGVVTSTPAGISCPATCSTPYNYGTMVTLTATPNPGSTFLGWSGSGCSGTGTCIITVTSASTVTATYGGQSIPLTVTLAGSGTGSVSSNPGGINCPSICSAFFAPSTMVTLTATPGTGSVFSGWSGACTSTGTCTLTLASAQSVTATFNATSFPLTIVHTGTGTIATTTSPPGINCPGTCVQNFPTGATVSIASIPAPGTTFSGFTGADSFSGNVAGVLMNAARTVTVRYRCAADFNGVNNVTVQDLFDYLAAWFAGCP